jgi:hypothetical protein
MILNSEKLSAPELAHLPTRLQAMHGYGAAQVALVHHAAAEAVAKGGSAAARAIATAEILLGLGLDHECICAALLPPSRSTGKTRLHLPNLRYGNRGIADLDQSHLQTSAPGAAGERKAAARTPHCNWKACATCCWRWPRMCVW